MFLLKGENNVCSIENKHYYNPVGVVTDRVRGLGYGPNLLKRGGAEELRSKPICQLTLPLKPGRIERGCISEIGLS